MASFDCKQCKYRLNERIPYGILPCGATLCSECIQSICVRNKMECKDQNFTCLICSKVHTIPEKGFNLSNEVDISKQLQLLKTNLNKIEKKFSKITLIINHPCDHIENYKLKLKNAVQLSTEQALLNLEEMREKYHAEIDEYTNECIRAYKSKQEIAKDEVYKALLDIVKELETFHLQFNKYLAQTDQADQVQIQIGNENAAALIKKAEYLIFDSEVSLFNGPKIEFKRNEVIEKMGAKVLGSFNFVQLISSSILSPSQTIRLLQLCEFSFNDQWKLTYKSVDGFKASSIDEFHLNCDHNPNSLVIIQTKKGNVFGGYTEQTWSGEHHKYDEHAFIFSFINPTNKPIKCRKIEINSKSIKASKWFGPTFGVGDYHDIHIFKCDDGKTANFSNLGYTYLSPDFRAENKRDTFLDGHFKFEIAKMEVFSKMLGK